MDNKYHYDHPLRHPYDPTADGRPREPDGVISTWRPTVAQRVRQAEGDAVYDYQ